MKSLRSEVIRNNIMEICQPGFAFPLKQKVIQPGWEGLPPLHGNTGKGGETKQTCSDRHVSGRAREGYCCSRTCWSLSAARKMGCVSMKSSRSVSAGRHTDYLYRASLNTPPLRLHPKSSPPHPTHTHSRNLQELPESLQVEAPPPPANGTFTNPLPVQEPEV